MKLLFFAQIKKELKNAVSSGAKVISVVISVSEAHNKANVNRSVAESFDELEEMVYKYPYIKFRLDLATVLVALLVKK